MTACSNGRKAAGASPIEAAVRGFGITRVLSYQIADRVRDGTLVTLLEEYEPDP
ncbi:MAG: hypothetical protein VW268_02925 [Rhodospirillaceae bacterium]